MCCELQDKLNIRNLEYRRDLQTLGEMCYAYGYYLRVLGVFEKLLYSDRYYILSLSYILNIDLLLCTVRKKYLQFTKLSLTS